MKQPANPLDDLQQFSSASLPSPPRPHSSGRRELRRQWLDRGISLLVRPKDDSAKIAMSKGEFVESLPIVRQTAKRQGMSKKELKKWKRELCESKKSS